MPETEQKKTAEIVTIHHKKSGCFRVVHADGAWGSANLAGIVALTFYSEQAAMPITVEVPVDENGIPAGIPHQKGDVGWHRDIEVSIALTIPAAMQVRQTLDNFIKIATDQLEQMNQKMEKAQKSAESK